MPRLVPSPALVSILVALFFGAGVAVPQDKGKLPLPRVVSEAPEPGAGQPAKAKEVPAAKVEQPKTEEPPKAPAAEAVTAKKDEPTDAAKGEAKKEDPKPDPVAEAKAAADKAGNAASDAQMRGDNAWVLAASALVLLMTPGLALFYGGMVRKKNVLATMMQSYAAMAVVGLYWVAVGYGLAFGPSRIIAPDGLADLIGGEAARGGGIVGWDWKLFFLQGVNPQDKLPGNNITVLAHVMFQGMFAIITPALISGAVAERIRFWPWTIFMLIWVTVVYCPLAHMVWAFDWFTPDPVDEGKGFGGTAIGLLGKAGALDFAGGTVVHIAAGFAGLACIFVLRKRTGYPGHAMHPNSMVLTLIGAGLLWFGWFGFNGGSALNATDLAGTGFATTQSAAAAAALTWCVVEWVFKGKPTALGLASGVVAGLVAVTPASGYVYPWGGALIGVAASIVCYFAVQVKALFGYDDSLDAFGVHGIGGFLGAVLTGVFSYALIQSASADGYFAMKSAAKRPDAIKTELKDLKAEIAKSEKAAADAEAAAKAAADQSAAKPADETLKKDAESAKKASDAAAGHLKRAKESAGKLKAELVDYVGADAAKAMPSGELTDLGIAEFTPDDLTKDGSPKKGRLPQYAEDKRTPMTQPVIQLKAACFSAVFAFALSLVIAAVVQLISLGNFRTSTAEENEGLDQTEHGETGFDFAGPDIFPTAHSKEPKAAKVPPGGKRFEVVVEGIENGGLMSAWSQLCQPKEDGPIDPDFKAVYPYVTTVQGNRFRLRGGDPKALSAHIQKLFTRKLGKPVKVRVEE